MEEPLRTDGALNQAFPDKVQALTGTKAAHSYADAITPPKEQDREVPYRVDSKAGGRVVYLSFGLEAVYRGYDSGENNTRVVLNYRSKLLHNAFCWMTTGQVSGRVVDISGLRPVWARWCERRRTRTRTARSHGRASRTQTETS